MRQLRVPTLRFKVPKVPRLPKRDAPYEDVFEEMTLQEHLEELRDRIVKSVVAVAVAFVAGVFLARPLLDEIVRAARVEGVGLDIQAPTDPIIVYFKVAIYAAIGFAMPVLVYQSIAFLAPGLTRKEKRILLGALPFVAFLFIAGVAYAFFFAVPRALDFLSRWQTDIFNWEPDSGQVINFYLTLMIGLGASFQLPIVMFLLAKLNVVSPQKMRQYRKYAFLLILVVAAIVTPTTDPINLSLVAVPLYLLYEVGMVVARVFATPTRRRPAER